MQTPETRERVFLVGLLRRPLPRSEFLDHLQELEALVHSAGGEVVGVFWQERSAPDVATFIGCGKVEELKPLIHHSGVSAVVFDDELSPVQVRNLERAWGVKVLDRPGVILQIFAMRARTQEAQLQVELAQLQYLLPRLSRLWTHLSRQAGGIGTRGPGETQLETDRRLIRRRIQVLQRKLQQIAQQRAQRRKGRETLPRFALVGYTNAGKSTLMRALTGAPVLVADRLFATLDTTVRRFRLPNGQIALLSDTVGFLRKLPPQLIAAFHSTLAEVQEADILIHVVDASHPHFREHIRVVDETLCTLGAHDKPTVLVFNKVDRLIHDRERLRELEAEFSSAVFISAERGINLRRLLLALQQAYEGQTELMTFLIPYTEARTLHGLRTAGELVRQEALEQGMLLQIRCPTAVGERLRQQYALYLHTVIPHHA
ncbi:MAG: GTPase HflX [Chlorobiota bacterium]